MKMTSLPQNKEKTAEELINNILENQITNMLDKIMTEENDEQTINSKSPEIFQNLYINSKYIYVPQINPYYSTINNYTINNQTLDHLHHFITFPFNNTNSQNTSNLFILQPQYQFLINSNNTSQSFEKRNRSPDQYHLNYLKNKSNLVNTQLDEMINELYINLVQHDKIKEQTFIIIKSNFIKLIKTHRGSIIIQNYLKNTNPQLIIDIFTHIKPFLLELMSDFYANYFCKKLYSFLQINERTYFLQQISSSITILSLNPIATYPIQFIIELMKSNQEKQILINSIKNSLSSLLLDTYGIHVIEKIIIGFEKEWTSCIFEFILNNFMFLACNNNAIYIIKKMLVLPHNENIHQRIKEFAMKNALQLIENQYGNYVIQVIVENWEEKEVMDVIKEFNGKYWELSNKKYASNVIERCFEKHQSILTIYVKEVCDSGKIGDVMKNSYGNYVIQKALKIIKGELREFLIENIDNNIYKLNDKKLMMKWKNMISNN